VGDPNLCRSCYGWVRMARAAQRHAAELPVASRQLQRGRPARQHRPGTDSAVGTFGSSTDASCRLQQIVRRLSPSTTCSRARRLCTVAGFYRYAEQEGLLERSPAAHVRRPRLDYESHATGLDRNEVGALLVAAGLASAREHALSPC